MHSQMIQQPSSSRIIGHGLFAPGADLLRVAAILAFFAGSAIAASHVADTPGAAHPPVSADWHGNVARSGW